MTGLVTTISGCETESHIRHAINIHIHIHSHIQVERSSKRAVLRTVSCRGREHRIALTRDETRQNAEERERMGGRERERVKENKRERRKKDRGEYKRMKPQRNTHTVLSSRWLYILVLCISFRVLASCGWERERNRGVREGTNEGKGKKEISG